MTLKQEPAEVTVPVITRMLDKFISFYKMAAGMAPDAPPVAPDVPIGTLAASQEQEMAAGALKTRALVCGVRG